MSRSFVVLIAICTAGCAGGSSPQGQRDLGAPAIDGSLPAKADDPDGPVEACNGLDDNSDGQVDEGCGCMPGEQQACFPAPFPAPALGLCHAGHQSCEATSDSEFAGHWGPCLDARAPEREICGDGIDQDCDGRDQPCACLPSCAGKVCGDDGCGGTCGSPPHACQTITQQKKAIMRQFFECLGCCDLNGLFAGQGLPPCSPGSPLDHHYYGGKHPGKPPTVPPYCMQLDLISDYPPCAGVAGPESSVGSVVLHEGDCPDEDPGVHEVTYQRTCTQ